MTAHDNASTGMKVMYIVWFWLLAITFIEVVLAYIQLDLFIMLLSLLGLSLIKAGLIVGYFMHLKFERRNLILTVVPAVVAAILLMNIIFPDSLRLRQKGVWNDIPPPTPEALHGGEDEGGH